MAAKGKRNKPNLKGKRSAQAEKAASPKQKRSVQLYTTFQKGFWRQHWLPVLLLLGIPFALYAVAIRFGYVLDDQMVYWQNAYVQKGFAGIRDIFGYDSFMGYFQKKENLFLLEGGRYRPLSLATFAMEVGLFGEKQTHISHFLNILFYGITGVVLYRVLLGFFPLKENGRW